MSPRNGSDQMILKLVGVFTILALCIGIAGYLYYDSQKKYIRQNISDELASIADLKVSQIANWRKERLEDAASIAANPLIARAFRAYEQNPASASAKSDIRLWLSSLQKITEFQSILLVNAQGAVRMTTNPQETAIGERARQLIDESLRSKKAILSDFHTATVFRVPHIDMVVPLLGSNSTDATPLGFILIRLKSAEFIDPLMQSWPGSSRSAETLLIRREGDSVLFLNELRHRKNTALTLRIPLDKIRLPAAMAVQGKTGVFEGLDYRDLPVLAATRLIPETPWILIAKIDNEEVYAPVKVQARFLTVVVLLLIIAAGVSIIFWWRKKSAEHLQAQTEVELARSTLLERYDLLSKYANDIILLVEQTGRIVEANDRALACYGYSREELLRMTVRDLRPPDTQPDTELHMKQVRERNGYIFETIHKRKDGEAFPVEVSSRVIESGGKTYFQSIIRDITERKQAEIALIKEKNRSEAIIAAMGDGISIQDTTFKILYQNQIHKNMIGSHIGQYCFEAYEHRGTTCDACPVAETFKDGRVHTTERSVQFDDGMHYFEITTSPLRDENGRIVAGIEAVRDITARRNSERSVAESEKRYRALFNNSLNGFALHEIVTDAAGLPVDYIFLEANKAFEQMTGLRTGQIVGKRVTEVLPGIEKTDFIKIYGNVALTGESIHFEQYAPPLNKYFEIAAFSPAQGQFATIFFDITLRKGAEQAQLASEKRYQRLVESVTDYIYTVEVRDGIALATSHGPGCVTVTGYTSEEYKNDRDLWHRMIFEADRDMVIEQANKILSGSPVLPFEHRIIHKNGSIRWVRNTPVPRLDSEGRLTAYDGLISDITQLKLLENQLRQAQKMEAVGQLAGGIAHDFNNILTAIIGYSNLLLMKMEADNPGRPYMNQIISSSERAAHLIHSLLAFSRKQIIDLKPMSINDVIRRVEKLLARVIGEDIEFKTKLADPDMLVLADSIQIEQVLMNLATNARDAMPDGGMLLISTEPMELGEDFIRTHSFGKPGRYVHISVTDTGIGMDETVQHRIFEPFFTTKEVGKGTGLGLAMVYGIIKQHNGFINVYSEPGKGTTFKIYLPLFGSTLEDALPAELDNIPRGTETVLLAEDDETVRNLTCSVLQDFGYSVIEAVDGEDAVLKFNEYQDRIDMLVFDIIMPRMNGKEAYLAINAIRPGIKVLFASGYTADIVHKKGILETGMEFVLKPITPSDFLKKVRAVLDKK